MSWRARLANWLDPRALPVPAEPDVTSPARGVSAVALAEAHASYGTPLQVYAELPRPAPGVVPATVAMDQAVPATYAQAANALMSWGLEGRFHEGIGFLGYPYLAELAQRPEYRQIVETYARDATRKWIKLKGPDDARLIELAKAMDDFGVQEKFRQISEKDGFFGRAHLFIDNGEANLATQLIVRPATIGKGRLKAFVVVEPTWTYPGIYNSTNPLSPDYYRPNEWYVMGQTVSTSRLLTFVAREVPDMLKAAYSFGGLSMSQMAKPYVDNWLRTRQSVSDLIHSFSTMVLATDMATVLSGGSAVPLNRRVDMFNRYRDNRGTMLINKETEELTNVKTPLANLDDLQAQSQEQMASVAGIPLVVLLGVTPSGLNASSDGEIRTYYDKITSYQEHLYRRPLTTVIQAVQCHIWGAIDEKITFKFESLWEMDDKDAAAIRKSDAEADTAYVNAGVVSPDEARDRLADDEQGLYYGVDLSAPAPEAPDDTDVLAGGGAGGDE